jgi:hypothetical protein
MIGDRHERGYALSAIAEQVGIATVSSRGANTTSRSAGWPETGGYAQKPDGTITAGSKPKRGIDSSSGRRFADIA